MASSAKSNAVPAARRKSSKPSMIVTLKLSPKALQAFAPVQPPVKEATPSKESALAAVIPPTPVAASLNGENPSESNSNTPATIGTPVPSLMPPPTDGVKKKGGKRAAAALDPDAPPKVRGKPGPKKKARLEDGSIDHSAAIPRASNVTHKLGPRANQGAINAGLRALDRSGKPCRKWQKGGFKMKTFTGVVWEIPRWKAPPKYNTQGTNEGQSASGDSSKENKDNSQMESEKSEKSNAGGPDVEMVSTPSQNLPSPPSSLPAPSAPIDAPTETPSAEVATVSASA